MTAKKKNPLKDLDAFLSQEASSLVQPEKVSGKEKEETKKKPPAKTSKKKTAKAPIPTKEKISTDTILKQLSALKEQEGDGFTEKLHGLMMKAIELYGDNSAKEKMLINTLLFIDNPDNWREAVKQYWESKN